jgi:hypothetical protein
VLVSRYVIDPALGLGTQFRRYALGEPALFLVFGARITGPPVTADLLTLARAGDKELHCYRIPGPFTTRRTHSRRPCCLPGRDSAALRSAPRASPSTWGTGLPAGNEHAASPAHWPGLNLPGCALMEMRHQLRSITAYVKRLREDRPSPYSHAGFPSPGPLRTASLRDAARLRRRVTAYGNARCAGVTAYGNARAAAELISSLNFPHPAGSTPAGWVTAHVSFEDRWPCQQLTRTFTAKRVSPAGPGR